MSSPLKFTAFHWSGPPFRVPPHVPVPRLLHPPYPDTCAGSLGTYSSLFFRQNQPKRTQICLGEVQIWSQGLSPSFWFCPSFRCRFSTPPSRPNACSFLRFSDSATSLQSAEVKWFFGSFRPVNMAAMLEVTTIFLIPFLTAASTTLLVPCTAGLMTSLGDFGAFAGKGLAVWIT